MTAKSESLNKLQLAQNVVCRTLLLANKETSIDLMHEELNLMKLNTRRNIHLGNLCHKNVHLEVPSGVNKYFLRRATAAVRVSRRTNQFTVLVQDIRSQVGRKAISFRGPVFWNNIPNELKDITKYSCFVNPWIKYCKANFENHPT